jgi:hypothetical protein
MKRVDEFDWIQVAQVLPETDGHSTSSILETCLTSRKMLLVLDAVQVGAPNKLLDRLMGVHSKVVGNPIARLLVLQRGEQAAANLLRARSAPAVPVDTLGVLADASLTYSAYMTWLLAETIASMPAGKRMPIPEDELTGWISDSNPVATRASAALTLAVLSETFRGP